MKSILCWCYLATTLLLAGCSNADSYTESALAIPLQPSFEQEVMLAKLEQVLAIKELSDDDRAQLLYRRGMLFDSLGLRVLARNDFSQALEIRPDIPEIYNFLGIYYTLEGNFDAAYESFDSVFELEPTYNYARFNRGMALYYGGRFSLAQDDLLAFYGDDPNDPYRSLWLYYAEREIDAKAAKAALQQRYEKAVKEQWGWNIVEFYLGKISKKELMNSLKMEATDNTSLAEHLSETHFYLGKYYLSLGDVNTAAAMFKLTVANNVYNFVEHRYALLELALLGQRQDDLSESDKE